MYNSSAWSWVDALASTGRRVWECKAWVAIVDWKGSLNRAAQGEEVGRGMAISFLLLVAGPFTVPLLHLSVFAPPLLSPLPSFILSTILLPSRSCVVLVHGGSQHQRTLLRDLWVFNHVLPHPLLFPIWVHPVYLVSVAFAFGGRWKHINHLFYFNLATREPRGNCWLSLPRKHAHKLQTTKMDFGYEIIFYLLYLNVTNVETKFACIKQHITFYHIICISEPDCNLKGK